MNDLSVQQFEMLNMLTITARVQMGKATESFLNLGDTLNSINNLVGTAGFKDYIDAHLGLSVSMAYKAIKVWKQFGNAGEASQLSSTVLIALASSDDPQARLKEALEAQQTKGSKVTVKEAKDIAKKAREVIDQGETVAYVPPTREEQERAVREIEESMEVVEETPEVASLRRVNRSKRILKAVFDLLVLEMSNAEIYDTDMKNAVLEMSLSDDESENQVIQQLREFCSLVTQAAN